MSMPFYVPPEQMMKDRADFARKGISRGRALIAAQSADGILIVAENPSKTLRKISEIYDRIAFAGVGKYNEFDQLRMLVQLSGSWQPPPRAWPHPQQGRSSASVREQVPPQPTEPQRTA
ncbi:MAG: proteasome alpha-type subunit [Actinomycetota bacterium]